MRWIRIASSGYSINVNRNTKHLKLALSIAALLLFGVVGVIFAAACDGTGGSGGETVTSLEPPPIDVSAPADFKTASFGFG